MKKIILTLIFSTQLFSQLGPWESSGRTHPELKWFTLETENFKIHYHNGIEDLAKEGAKIAEYVLPKLLQQIGVSENPKVDITFTAEDEIMNGYALWTNSIYIWVDQNDTPIWLEDEKWLYQVVSHELQHVVLINAMKSWFPEPFGIFLFANVPGWFIEGAAEFYTEKWRPGRADLAHKTHILKNKLNQMDPHNDGYSKLLYLSSKFGDSTIAKLAKWRDKNLKLLNFESAFLELTGQNLNQFEEDWRRHMNTYYYGVRAQKETYDEVGKVETLPIKNVSYFKFSEDSLNICAIGKLDKTQWDESLILAIEDTAKAKKSLFSFLKKDKEDSVKKNNNYKINEIDFGSFGTLNWSPDNKKIAYSKYHFGSKQEMIWDIKIYNLDTKKNKWITNSLRASYPVFSRDGKNICFIAHKNNISNLFIYEVESEKITQLTNFNFDIQILSPDYSPENNKIAYAASREDGNLNIEILDLNSKEIKIISKNPEADYNPIWIDENIIAFTSHKNGTPNIYTIKIDSLQQKQITDIGDAMFTLQLGPKSKNIFALTLNDVDTSRFVNLNLDRNISTTNLSIRNNFSEWRNTTPTIKLNPPTKDFAIKINSIEEYSALKNIKHFASIAFPYLDGSGFFGFTSWVDGLGRNLFTVGSSIEKNKNGIYASFLNAQYYPILSIEYFENVRSSFRYYDNYSNGLFEYLNGITFSGLINYNFGNSMASNHNLTLDYNLQNRLIDGLDKINFDDSKSYLLKPENAKEEFVKIKYSFLDYRPNALDYFKQTSKTGLILNFKNSFSFKYGNYNYSRLSLDLFSTIPIGPIGIYSRLKSELINGKSPNQDYIGITKDLPLYLPIMTEGIFNLPENYSFRGIDTVKLGDRIVFGTLELRIPLVKNLPINILGFSIGSINFSAISDFGNAWYVGKKEKFNLFSTLGYETKFALQVGENPLVYFAIGSAQPIKNWKDKKNNPQKYFRMVLVSPL